MRYFYRLLILPLFLFSASGYAMEFFADALYWQANEPIDWALTNNLSTSNQAITYKTVDFGFAPGFRVGIASEGSWDTKFYYTKYNTSAHESTSGNVTSAFLAGKIVQPPGVFFFQSGQSKFKIDFNMFDWDFGKRFNINERLMLHPIVGLEGGWINQSIKSTFQSQPISIAENIKNNFSGIGPKMGIGTQLALLRSTNSQVNFIADFATSYLWGNWQIKDKLHADTARVINIDVGHRDLGALTLQAMMGFGFDYKKLSMKLGYEISDWFNQCQIYDDATGPHHNDLILQGVTLKVSYEI